MSVLIKGMEMPKKKNGAVIIIYPDGQAVFEDGTKYDAIEIPPHGRLIDADDIENITVIMNKSGCGFKRIEAPTIIESEGDDGNKN